ncbi:MAG: hypothetical protein ACRDKE_05920 [Solirubrobacterales bacterium]
MAVGFIDLPSGTELHPGESIELTITFWNWPSLEAQIYPGREWRIQEGATLESFRLISKRNRRS